jgi:hypothetical protein
VPFVVGMSVVVLLVVSENDSSALECYMVCHQIHSLCSHLVGTVHIAPSFSRGTFEFVLTCVKVEVGSSAYVITMNNCAVTLVSKFVCSTLGPPFTLFRRLGPS